MDKYYPELLNDETDTAFCIKECKKRRMYKDCLDCSFRDWCRSECENDPLEWLYGKLK